MNVRVYLCMCMCMCVDGGACVSVYVYVYVCGWMCVCYLHVFQVCTELEYIDSYTMHNVCEGWGGRGG